MHESLQHLITSYGYVFLFLIIGIESFGVPLPGETALVTAAAYAALGRLNIVGVIAAAAAGAIVGDNAGYWLGRKGGIALVHRFGKRVGLDDAKLARAHAFFERYGARTVFIGRFIALLRSWAAVLAGVASMPFRTFMLYNALGGIAWATIFGGLGYAFGRNLPRLERYVGQISLALVLLALLVALTLLAMRWFSDNRVRLAAWVTEHWQQFALASRFARVRERHPDVWSWIAARFARGEYLGLHLTGGFLLSVAALWLFGAVTEDVVHHDPLTALDLQLASFLRTHSTHAGDQVARVVSAIGSPVAMALLAVVVALILARRRHWIVLSAWAAAFVGAGVLDWTLKRVIYRPRPAGAEAFLYGGASFSFPSGHAMGSLVGYGMSVYLLVVYWPPARRHRVALGVTATVLVLLIGLSRLYLGVHFLSDVIAGYAAALVWLTVCITGAEIALRQRGLAPWEVGVDRRRRARAPAVDAGRTL
ncbi:MAG TPA: bifunctional DedA family/phosphatase PAP2 family protein [Gemmatimonadaceae bacterium]